MFEIENTTLGKNIKNEILTRLPLYISLNDSGTEEYAIRQVVYSNSLWYEKDVLNLKKFLLETKEELPHGLAIAVRSINSDLSIAKVKLSVLNGLFPQWKIDSLFRKVERDILENKKNIFHKKVVLAVRDYTNKCLRENGVEIRS